MTIDDVQRSRREPASTVDIGVKCGLLVAARSVNLQRTEAISELSTLQGHITRHRALIANAQVTQVIIAYEVAGHVDVAQVHDAGRPSVHDSTDNRVAAIYAHIGLIVRFDCHCSGAAVIAGSRIDGCGVDNPIELRVDLVLIRATSDTDHNVAESAYRCAEVSICGVSRDGISVLQPNRGTIQPDDSVGTACVTSKRSDACVS